MTTATYLVHPAADELSPMGVTGPFPTREAAEAAAGRNDYVIGAVGDVLWTGRVLVEVFNAVSGARVKKFESYQVGVTRLMDAIVKAATPSATAREEILPVASRLTDEQKAERERAAAIKKAERERAAADRKAAREAKKAEREATRAAKTSDRAPVRKISGAGTITVLAEKNPKREGTKAHGAFSLYRDGMTCDEFIAAGGSKGDLSWDRSHGFISITEASA